MVVPVLTNRHEMREVSELLRPEALPEGGLPEERLVVCGMSWKRYLAVDKIFGEDRPGPRLFYLESDIEIMTASDEHERIKKWISDLLSDYFFESGIEVVPRGQATIRDPQVQAGAEPDESWCLGQEKEFPDLILEIALTSGGVNKLEIYRRFRVAEVWFWRSGKLEAFALRANGEGYDQISASRLLPQLDLGLLERCVRIRSWREARLTFRRGFKKRA